MNSEAVHKIMLGRSNQKSSKIQKKYTKVFLLVTDNNKNSKLNNFININHPITSVTEPLF